LFTRTRSPSCSVGCIDGDGMKNAWTRKDLISRARTNAITMRAGSSFRKESGPFGFCCLAGLPSRSFVATAVPDGEGSAGAGPAGGVSTGAGRGGGGSAGSLEAGGRSATR
jgi:hypothetical protein